MAKLSVQEFLREREAPGRVTLDVRTPAEFAHAHIPGAHNLPLFDDEQRAVVGTVYKRKGRHEAIKLGLELVGPKMRGFVDEVESLSGRPGSAPVFVHCWRGGMRSGALAWLLSFSGWEVQTLGGGYKAFRHWVLDRINDIPRLRVLGGRTGSGKTLLLHELAAHGEPILDLEALANHRGSSFGALQLPEQPSQEQFEALLAMALRALPVDAGPVWVEDESRMIGSCKVPDALMAAMRSTRVTAVRVDVDDRVRTLVDIYGDAPIGGLVESFQRIEKRLGRERTREALEALDARDLATAARIALAYYDKAYDFGLSKRGEHGVRWYDGPMEAESLIAFARASEREEEADE